MHDLSQNRPHVMKRMGNAIFAHIPDSFTDAEMENWINKTEPLGDVLWKIAPKTVEYPQNRAECGAGAGWHVAFTVDGQEFVSEEGTTARVSTRGVSGIEAREDHGHQHQHEELDHSQAMLRLIGGMIPRPVEPIIAVEGVGAGSLLNFKPETSSHLKQFMHQIMRGPGPLTFAEREGIATAVSMANNALWCTFAHREVGYILAGGKDAFADLMRSNRMKSLGAIVVAVVNGIHTPPDILNQARLDGWTDEALHDAVLIAGAFTMMNKYVEGLAARTPNGDDPVYEEVATRLAHQGYLS